MLRFITIIFIVLIFFPVDLCPDYFIVNDIEAGGIIKVNSDTGDREQLIGSWIAYPRSIICDEQNNYYVSDNTKWYVIKVNEESVSIVSSCKRSGMPIGQGEEYFKPSGIALHNNHLFVCVEGGSIYKVDINTGDRTFFSYMYLGNMRWFYCMDIIYYNGYLYGVGEYVDYNRDRNLFWGVCKIDENTGETTLIASDEIGEGPPLYLSRKVKMDNDGNLIVLTLDSEIEAITKVYVDTGNRELISATGVGYPNPRGGGPEFGCPQGLVVNQDGSIYVVDYYLHSILYVDPVSGDREIIWTNKDVIKYPEDITLNADGDFVIVDQSIQSLIIVNKENFSYKILDSVYYNRGEKVPSVSDMAVRYNNIYIEYNDKIYRYDLTTKYLTLVASNDINEGPPLTTITAINIDKYNHPILGLTDYMLNIDPYTGYRELVAGNHLGKVNDYPKGNGPDFWGITSLIEDIDGNYMVSGSWNGTPWPYLYIFTALCRVDRNTGDRVVVSNYIGRCLTLDSNNDYVGMGDPYILKLDRETSDIEILYDEVGDDTEGFCFDSEWNWILTDYMKNCVIKVDPITKEKTIISQAGETGLLKGYGPALLHPWGIALLPKMTDVENNLWEVYE